jgi:tetratricopeptide (TPR) repeat protein
MSSSSFGKEFGLLVKRRRAERGLTQGGLAELVWPTGNTKEDHPRKGEISRLESGRVSNPQERTVLALCEALGIREGEINALRLAPPPDPYGLAKVLANLTLASQSDLYALARAFGDAEPEQRSDAALRDFLADKAHEHANYQKIIDALDDRVAAIANLKGEAKDAAARLDFDQVEPLLSRVLEVELDIAAATAQARAENALMQGKADHAFTLFSATADSFAAIGPVEVAKRRRTYAIRLTDHGIRYGGASLALAIRLLERLLTDLPQTDDPWLWGAAQSSLANACQTLGTRTDGQPGTTLLERAVKAYEAALQVHPRKDDALNCAIDMQNLAGALMEQGRRTDGLAGTALLARAVDAYDQALQVRTRTDHPVQWAMTLQNLAGGLQELGRRTDGQVGSALLARAVEAYEQALEVRTRADNPVHWATTLQNLSIALQEQGCRTDGQAGNALLTRAVDAYLQALQVFTRADHPVDWAGTLQNLANTLQEQGRRTEGQAGIALFARAVDAYEQALQVRTRADHPVQWAMTQENLAICHVVWSQHPACDDPAAHLGRALEHVEAALTVYDPDHMAFYHAKATRLRVAIHTALAATG